MEQRRRVLLAGSAILAAAVAPRPVSSVAQDPFHPPVHCEAPAAMAKSSIGLPEAQGRISGGSLWALFFQPLAPGGDGVKIVWRVTGTGAFSVKAYSPSGAMLAPDWGPQMHDGSNWDRPGDEWGTKFVFPTAGCWDLHVTRGQASGDLWMDVK
jgi:hypothetical protein